MNHLDKYSVEDLAEAWDNVVDTKVGRDGYLIMTSSELEYLEEIAHYFEDRHWS